MQTIICPYCKTELELPQSMIGKKVSCSQCNATFIAYDENDIGWCATPDVVAMEEKMRSSQPQQQEEKSNSTFNHALRTALSIYNAIRSKKGLLCLSAITLLLLIFFIPRYRYTVVRSGNAIYRTNNFTGKTVRICGTSIFECKEEKPTVVEQKPIQPPVITKPVYTPPPKPVYTLPPKPSLYALKDNEISNISASIICYPNGGEPYLVGRFFNENNFIHVKSITIEVFSIINGLSHVITNDHHSYIFDVDIPPSKMGRYSIPVLNSYSFKKNDEKYGISSKWIIKSAAGYFDFDFDKIPILRE